MARIQPLYTTDFFRDLPRDVRLLRPEDKDYRDLIEGLNFLKGHMADMLHPGGRSIRPVPGEAGFTLVHMVPGHAASHPAGYMTGKVLRDGQDLKLGIASVFVDRKFRRCGIASRLADGMAGVAFNAMEQERQRHPEYGYPDCHVAYIPVSLGGEAVCQRVERRIRDTVLDVEVPGSWMSGQVQEPEMRL